VITQRKELRAQVRHLPGADNAKLKLAPILPMAAFENALVDLLARRAFIENTGPIRTRDAFQKLSGERVRRIAEAACEIGPWLPALTESYHQARREWESIPASDRSGLLADVKEQVRQLTFPGFLSSVPWGWLRHYPRYFNAIAYRLEKYRSGGTARDAESLRVIHDLWRRWAAARPQTDVSAEALAQSDFRWMMEELRVSLFAQPLGTSITVSPKRCEKLILAAQA